MSEPSSSVAALLLTGGASRRMGRDKSQLIFDGTTLAERTGSLLLHVVATALEVGPGVSKLPSVREEPPGRGPLVAIAAGTDELRTRGHDGGALVVACDLPFLSDSLLRYLVEWDSSDTVLPIVHGRPQPLCAKWGQRDLDAASSLVARGVRSLQHLATQPGVTLLDEPQWSRVTNDAAFADVDTPDDLQRWGLST